MTSRQRILLTVTVSVIGVLILEGIVLLIGMFSGLYDIAASRPHIKPVEWLLGAAMDRSVEVHARGIKAPLEVPAAVGAAHFDEMCAGCHGAPGVERSEIGRGLYPDPPDLSESANDWTVEQVYWIVKYGVKDTGMPAFGPTHDEKELWAMAYMAKRLPSLTPAEYQALLFKPSHPDQSGEPAGSGNSQEQRQK